MKKIDIPKHILFLFSVYASGIIFFLFFRFLLVFANLDMINEKSGEYLWYAFLNRGLLFDSVVSSYVLLIPFLLLSVDYFVKKESSTFYFGLNIYLAVFYTSTFAICASDIPYFLYYNSRITRNVMDWFTAESISTAYKEFFTNKIYLLYFFIFIAVSALFSYFLFKYLKKILESDGQANNDRIYTKIAVTLVSFFLMLIIIRGDWNLYNKPIGAEDTFFSDYPFINQLGTNAVFNFSYSFKYFKIDYFEDKNAIKKVQDYLKIEPGYDSPIARKVDFEGKGKKPNIVVIMVESLTTAKMGYFGYKDNTMPFLDNMITKSLSFTNIYTSGIHTYTGIFSTFVSYPTLMQNKVMQSTNTASQTFSGIATVLKEHGYYTSFFATGDKSFDNMNGFLLNNDFDRIYSNVDYPEEWIFDFWGVPDHRLFEYSVDEFGKLSKKDKPFFAVLLTVSAHEGFNVPPANGFKARSENKDDRLYEYTDWSIERFFASAEKQDWFENTIFVILGDHGQVFDPVYEMSLSYHHTPLIIYAPKLVQPEVKDALGLQMDVFPTLMGLIGLPYINNTLGVDLLREERPFAYFSADTKLGVLNKDFFLVLRNNGKDTLYKYKDKDIKNYISDNEHLVREMKEYSYSMLQTAQWMIENRKVGMPYPY